ncbi:unnamed protein product, partial [Discosporangium mesarthrocarpum]
MQLVSIPQQEEGKGGGGEVALEYDVEWLALIKKTHHLLTTDYRKVRQGAQGY